jgi:phosphoserine/homoserine phosphotransferase
LKILDEHGLKLSDIQHVIGTLNPLEAPKNFWMNYGRWCSHHPLRYFRAVRQSTAAAVGVADFAVPHVVVEKDRIVDYRLRIRSKSNGGCCFEAVELQRDCGWDSYNDTAMLCEAHVEFFFVRLRT